MAQEWWERSEQKNIGTPNQGIAQNQPPVTQPLPSAPLPNRAQVDGQGLGPQQQAPAMNNLAQENAMLRQENAELREALSRYAARFGALD